MLLAAAVFAVVLAAQESPEPMACDVGPVTRTYGGSDWLVYGCDDERTLVFVSAPGSPAMPFWFMSTPTEEGYRLYGEGNGSEDATRPAYEALSQLTETARNALLFETRAALTAPQH